MSDITQYKQRAFIKNLVLPILSWMEVYKRNESEFDKEAEGIDMALKNSIVFG